MNELYLYAFMGLLFHVIKSYESILSKSNYQFKKAFIDWPWQKVLVSTVLSIIAIVMIMATKDSFADIFPITTALHAIVVGFTAQSLLKSVIDRKIGKQIKETPVSDDLKKD